MKVTKSLNNPHKWGETPQGAAILEMRPKTERKPITELLERVWRGVGWGGCHLPAGEWKMPPCLPRLGNNR